MSKRRVVVTGLGIVSPVGSKIEAAWKNITEGQSGINFIRPDPTAADDPRRWKMHHRLGLFVWRRLPEDSLRV